MALAHNPTVFVIDNDASIRASIQGLLRSEGLRSDVLSRCTAGGKSEWRFTRDITFTSDSFWYSSPHLFAIHQRMGEEMQNYQPEICTKGANNPPCAHGEGEYLLGVEQS